MGNLFNPFTGLPDLVNTCIAKLRSSANKLFYSDSDGVIQELEFGEDGEALLSTGPTTAPEWAKVIVASEVVYKEAAEDISALRVVKGTLDGKVEYCTLSTSDAGVAIGISSTAGLTGEIISIVISGELQDASWSWDVMKPIYLGSNGTLTQTTPLIGYHQVIAIPKSSDTLKVSIQQPIIRI